MTTPQLLRKTLLSLCVLLSVTAAPADSRAPLQQNLVRTNYLASTEKIYDAFRHRLFYYTAIRDTRFFGVPVLMHEYTHEPLRCVERYIRTYCPGEYEFVALSGWRLENTFKKQKDRRRQEYSNHPFGLALDIDPGRNPCCQCYGKKWTSNPRCLEENGAVTNSDGTITGHYDLPECWIYAFKKYGWHWLGDDVLRDTMHFEFLALPNTVTCPH